MARSGLCHFHGRAEPAPPRGGLSRARWPSGGRSEMTRKVIFSEGRTPCVRIARPCPCRGILLVEMVGRTAPGLTGMCLVQAQACFNGRAEPAPPQIRVGRKPGHVTVTGSLARAWWPKNATFGLASCRHCGPAEPAPPQRRGARGVGLVVWGRDQSFGPFL